MKITIPEPVITWRTTEAEREDSWTPRQVNEAMVGETVIFRHESDSIAEYAREAAEDMLGERLARLLNPTEYEA